MRFDFHDGMRSLLVLAIGAIAIGEKTLGVAAFDHCSVVRVSEHRAAWIRRMRGANHPEQARLLRHAVDDPRCVENLVPAVLEFACANIVSSNVGGIAVKPHVSIDEVVDLVIGQREAKLCIHLGERCAATLAERNRHQRTRREMTEERIGRLRAIEHRFGHPVVKQRRDFGVRAAALYAVCDAALDAANEIESAVARDIGRLGGPRRDRPQARRDEVQLASRLGIERIAVLKQPFEQCALGHCRIARDFDEMPERRAGDGEARVKGFERCFELGASERGKPRAPAQSEDRHVRRVGEPGLYRRPRAAPRSSV